MVYEAGRGKKTTLNQKNVMTVLTKKVKIDGLMVQKVILIEQI